MRSHIHIPVWKKWASYFTEIVLEHTSSDYNEVLTVSLVKGRLQLSTEEAIYSYADKYDNFRVTFEKMILPEKAHVLLLGFGLGSIPFMLEKIFGKTYSYTGVEIDETVIHMASKYVLWDLKSDIELHQADAIYFVAQDTNKYDLIAIDLFISEKIPAVFEEVDFLESVNENLTSNGVLLFNRLAKTEKELTTTKRYYEEVFCKVFPSATYVEIQGNHVLVSDKKALK